MISKQSLQGELKESLLQKNEVKTSTLRLLLAAVSNKEKEKRYKVSKAEPGLGEEHLQEKSMLSEQEVQDAVSFEVKKRREAIEGFEKGGRKEQADKERQEMGILQVYLPAQLSEEEIAQLVRDAIVKTGATGPQDLGKVMGVLAPQTKGRADGTQVSALVKQLLS